MSAPNALHSLFGGSTARRALAGNVGVQVRLNEVHTSDWILDAVRETFGGTIAYDPCAATDQKHWFAEKNETIPVAAQKLVKKLGRAETKAERRELKRALRPYFLRLPTELVDRTFINPPYDYLMQWMRLADIAGSHDLRTVELIPVRTHRSWWTRYAAGANGVWLAPFPFKGHKQAFPAGLCLLARNCEIPNLGKRETGRFRLGA